MGNGKSTGKFCLSDASERNDRQSGPAALESVDMYAEPLQQALGCVVVCCASSALQHFLRNTPPISATHAGRAGALAGLDRREQQLA